MASTVSRRSRRARGAAARRRKAAALASMSGRTSARSRSSRPPAGPDPPSRPLMPGLVRVAIEEVIGHLFSVYLVFYITFLPIKKSESAPLSRHHGPASLVASAPCSADAPSSAAPPPSPSPASPWPPPAPPAGCPTAVKSHTAPLPHLRLDQAPGSGPRQAAARRRQAGEAGRGLRLDRGTGLGEGQRGRLPAVLGDPAQHHLQVAGRQGRQPVPQAGRLSRRPHRHARSPAPTAWR